ncbi:MAG: T9SS type A sorting domain-containing protein [Bacteroidota bacterium]
MRTGLLLFLLLLSAGVLRAQPTLTQSDIGPVGSSFTLGVDNDFAPGFNLGPSGANVAWDFSGLNVNGYDTIEFIDPATTPFSTDFPNSNLTIVQSSLPGGYAYMESTPNFLQLVGVAGDPFGFNQTFVVDQDPALRVANFPFTYQDQFLDTTELDITIDASILNIPLADSARYQQIQHRDIVGDAWGELVLWSGPFPNALRTKEVVTSYDSVWIKTFGFWTLIQDSSYTDSTFTWWDNTKGYYLAEAVYEGPDLDRISYQDPNPVALAPAIPTDVKVYPNPASDRLIVEQGQRLHESLELLDLQGRILRQMPLSGYRNDLDLSGLAPGLYLYRLKGTDGVRTRGGKLTVIRQ